MMPRAGGEYVFIREAYGPLLGFLYGWTRFFVASTGGIAAPRRRVRDLPQHPQRRRASAVRGSRRPGRLSQSLIGACRSWPSPRCLIVTLVNCAAVAVSGRIASVLTALRSRSCWASALAPCCWRTDRGRISRWPTPAARAKAWRRRPRRRRGLRRGDARRALGLRRLERCDVRRRRSQEPAAQPAAARSSAGSASSRRCTSSSTSPTSTS